MVELVHEVGVELIEASASDNMVAMAAWVSNDADSADRLRDLPKVRGLINFLYRERHMSPFEHGHFTFKVDVPLFVAREFMRHRTASYNEVSGRYTVMKPRFYCGEVARVQQGKMGNYFFVDGSNEQTAIYLQKKRKGLKKQWKAYEDLLEAGVAKEQAREDLPMSLMTQFYVTMNPRNLMQFLTLRDDSHALKEIRDVAVKMDAIFEKTMPITYQAYKDGRKRDEESVDEVSAKNAELTRRLNVMSRQVETLISENTSLKAAKADVERKHADVVAEYNRDFVAKQEQEEKVTDGPIDFNSVVNEGLDYIIPKMGRIVESATPVYKVYLNTKDVDAGGVTRSILDGISKFEQRRKR